MSDQENLLRVTIEAELEKLEQNMRKAGRLVDTTVAGMDKGTKRAAQAFNKLEAALDPSARAAVRLERDSAKVKLALDKGAISTERAAQVQKKLNDQYERASMGLKGLGGGAAGAGRNFNRLGPQIQNASYQIGDFAVQVAAGTSATRALTMQLPQLLGGFGAVGAVLGAVAAIGGALIPVLFDSGDASKDAAKGADAYKAALDAVAETQKKVQELQQKLNDTWKGALVQPFENKVNELDAQIAAVNARIQKFNEATGGRFKLASETTQMKDLQKQLEEARKSRDEALKTQNDKEQGERDLALKSLSEKAAAQDKLNAMIRAGTLAVEDMDAAQKALEEGFAIDSSGCAEFVASSARIREVKQSLDEAAKAHENAARAAKRHGEALEAYRASMSVENTALRLQVEGREAAADWVREEARLRERLGPLYDANADGLRALWVEQQNYKTALEETANAQRADERARNNISAEFEKVQRANGGAVAALEDWRAKSLAALDETKAGYEDFAREVEDIYRHRLADARLQDLQNSREWSAGVQTALRDYEDTATNAAKNASTITANGLRSMEDSLVSFSMGAKTAKEAFRDFALSVVEDLIRMQVRQSITGPLSGLLSGVFSGFTGGFTGGFGGGGATVGVPNTYTPVSVMTAHTGIGNASEASQSRYVHPAVFDNAPRYHSGRIPGVAAFEEPAIIRKDESVLTPGQMRQLAPKSSAAPAIHLTDARTINVYGGSGDVQAEVEAALAKERPRWTRAAVNEAKAAVRQEHRSNPNYLQV